MTVGDLPPVEPRKPVLVNSLADLEKLVAGRDVVHIDADSLGLDEGRNALYLGRERDAWYTENHYAIFLRRGSEREIYRLVSYIPETTFNGGKISLANGIDGPVSTLQHVGDSGYELNDFILRGAGL